MVEKILTSDEILNKYKHFLTVGGIKQFVQEYNIPDTAKVVIQRIYDVYYEKHSWGVLLKEGMHSDENIPETMSQYTPAWCCVKYSDEPDILFINLHY